MKKIDKKALDFWLNYNDPMEEEVIDRISYVVQKICDVFEAELNTWFFDDAEEGEVGSVKNHINSTEVYDYVIDIDNQNNIHFIILDKDGKKLDISDQFPRRWLHEDFEKELIEGKSSFLKTEQERKEKQKLSREIKKANDLKMLEKAKKKLSKEELAALKRAL